MEDRREANRVWWLLLRERDNLEDLNVDGRVIKNESSRNRMEIVEYIDMAPDKDL
jgi:hypothetical protein